MARFLMPILAKLVIGYILIPYSLFQQRYIGFIHRILKIPPIIRTYLHHPNSYSENWLMFGKVANINKWLRINSLKVVCFPAVTKLRTRWVSDEGGQLHPRATRGEEFSIDGLSSEASFSRGGMNFFSNCIVTAPCCSFRRCISYKTVLDYIVPYK